MSELARRISLSRELVVWIGDQVEGKSLKADDRRRLAAGLISVAMGHHSSLIQLLELKRPASALALVRSLIDCVVRALWVTHLASEAELAGFVRGDDPPPTLKIIEKLEGTSLFDVGNLSVPLKTVWPVVCDFNHGGGRMVTRHLTATDIGPIFTSDELSEALKVANMWGLGSACALADLMEDPDLGSLFLARTDHIP